ncbi:MAG: NlpC/P60 family protein [Bacteroidota bacterium]
MQYGLGHLSTIPIRSTAELSATMVSQLLYGECFKIKEERKTVSRIQVSADGLEGWVQNNQITKITQAQFDHFADLKKARYNLDFLSYAATPHQELIPIVLGSRVDTTPSVLQHQIEDNDHSTTPDTFDLVRIALLYLHSPYLCGGKTPFGIDASGLTQMVYQINGQQLKRSCEEQATQGEALSFIEESSPGDLAFFDNSEGTIDHVGIILEDNYIIHAHGQVRIDRLDHTGIFNTQLRRYSHSLRVIKKM